MNRTRWLELQEIFEAALPLDEAARCALLEERANGDPDLRAEAEGMLRAYGEICRAQTSSSAATPEWLKSGWRIAWIREGLALYRQEFGEDSVPFPFRARRFEKAWTVRGLLREVSFPSSRDDRFRAATVKEPVRKLSARLIQKPQNSNLKLPCTCRGWKP
jgi:hypothetical protein